MPGAIFSRRVVQADDRRHVQRARENGRVIRPAAGVRDERLERAPVELRRHRWRQLVGHEHAGRLALAEHVAEPGAAWRQVHAEPADDVRQVALALAKIRIFNRVEDRAEMIERPAAAPTRR